MWVLLLLMVAMVLGEDPTLSSDDGDARPSRYQHFEYSEELAQLALVYSSAAYATNPFVANWSFVNPACNNQTEGFIVNETYVGEGTEAFGYIGVDPVNKRIVAAFKGTSNLRDWMTDLRTWVTYNKRCAPDVRIQPLNGFFPASSTDATSRRARASSSSSSSYFSISPLWTGGGEWRGGWHRDGGGGGVDLEKNTVEAAVGERGPSFGSVNRESGMITRQTKQHGEVEVSCNGGCGDGAEEKREKDLLPSLEKVVEENKEEEDRDDPKSIRRRRQQQQQQQQQQPQQQRPHKADGDDTATNETEKGNSRQVLERVTAHDSRRRRRRRRRHIQAQADLPNAPDSDADPADDEPEEDLLIGNVHFGFCEYYQSVVTEGFGDRMALLARENPDYLILVTGHSLGAAAASVCAADLTQRLGIESERVVLYTMGEPRTGDGVFAEGLNDHVGTAYRLVHKKDVVPHLSICCHAWLGKCIPAESHCPYQHCSEVLYDNDMAPGDPWKQCNGTIGEDYLCDPQAFDFSVSDHTHYFQKNVGTYCASDPLEMPPFDMMKAQEEARWADYDEAIRREDDAYVKWFGNPIDNPIAIPVVQ